MSKRIPSYRRHKSTGRAVVTINGQDIYLGKYGSIESHEKYGQLIAQFASKAAVQVQPATGPAADRTLTEIVLAFMHHAAEYYVKDGKRTAEYDSFKCAVRPLVELYGETSVENFGPNSLRAVQHKMIGMKWIRRDRNNKKKQIDRTWSRRFINKSICRIRHIFKWAKSRELIKTKGIVEDLQTLEPLLEGRCDATELPERTPVPEESIQAVREAVNERTRDMIDLCLATGARPGELVSLTTAMIDRTGDVWTADLRSHKTQHHGKKRTLAFNANDQMILRKYMQADPDARLFPIRRDTFSKTVVYWCKKLGLPEFTGHWLRHNAASKTRAWGDLDDAQALLGHSDQKTTQRYAHLKDDRIIEIARKRG